MSLTTILSELWRFIWDKKVKILVGALIIGVLSILGSYFLTSLNSQPTEPEENQGQTEAITDEEFEESRNYLAEIYEQVPAEFEIFVQLEDGNVFGNSFIFDEYFSSPEVVEEVENRTGTSFGDTLEHEQRLELFKTSQYRGSIAGIRDTSSNIITIRVQAAQTAEDNLAISEAFLNMIENQEVPFADGLEITVMSEPQNIERLTEGDLEMVSSPEALGTFAPADSENRSFVLYGIAGFIIGLLIMSVLLFIIQLFRDTISYAFQYSWDFDDHHIRYSLNDSDENKDLVELILYPETESQIILAQTSDTMEEYADLINTSVEQRLSLNMDKPEEVVLLVENDVTEKVWYNEQYHLAEIYGSKIKIIQLLN